MGSSEDQERTRREERVTRKSWNEMSVGRSAQGSVSISHSFKITNRDKREKKSDK